MDDKAQIKKAGFLNRFYIATISGAVYEAETKDPDAPGGWPPPATLRKIAHEDGMTSKVPVGGELPQGDYLAITAGFGVFSYHEDNPRNDRRQHAGEVNMAFWRSGTSNIVGLFETSNEAAACAKLNGKNGIQFDRRWQDSTLKVLDMIGDSHPRFVPSRGGTLDPRAFIKETKKSA